MNPMNNNSLFNNFYQHSLTILSGFYDVGDVGGLLFYDVNPHNETNGLIIEDANDANANILEEAPIKDKKAKGEQPSIEITPNIDADLSLSVSTQKNELIQPSSFNYKYLANFLQQLNPSDTDLGLTLKDYMFSECLKIFNKQNEDADISNENPYVSGEIMYLLEIAVSLFGKYDEKKFKNSLNNLSKCSDTNVKLSLVANLGKELLDMPLYTILSRKSPYAKDNPEECFLNSMKICVDWIYATIKYTNFYLDWNNEVVDKLKGAINDWKNNLKIIKIDGFDENSFKGFSKLNTIRANIKIIDEFIDVGAGGHLQKSGIVNDHLYLKFKNKFSIYKCLKTLHEKIESTNIVLISENNKLIQVAENGHLATFKNNKTGVICPYNEENLVIFKQLPMLVSKLSSLLGNNLEAINVRFSKLCKDYESIRGEKTDAEVNSALTWLLFGDEFSESKRYAKKISNPALNADVNAKKKNQQQLAKEKNKTQVISKKGQYSDLKEHAAKHPKESSRCSVISVVNNEIPSQEQILSNHSQYIYKLENTIKRDLLSNRKVAKLDGAELDRAKTHSRELRDHLLYASLNFDLFCKAIQSQDLYAIGAIIPFLCMDNHIALEQMLKHRIIVKKMIPCNSHNLSELYSHSKCVLTFDQRSFIEEFSDAMLQARYPVSWAHKVHKGEIPEPLKWMQYSQNLCDTINSDNDSSVDPADLINLCNFVFNSYAMTLQCILHELDADAEIHQSTSQMSESLVSLKGILESMIVENKDNLILQAIKIKKSSLAENNTKTILKTQSNKAKKSQVCEKDTQPILTIAENLLVIGSDILKKVDRDEATPMKRILQEAANHLGRIDAVDYLQKNYKDMRFAALHHRNLLMFQWVYEQLYRFNGYVAGMGELSWICNHNLKIFHAYAFPDVPIPTKLTEFNFGRNLHYSHEWGDGKSLQMMQDLLKTRKILKNLDSDDWLRSKSKKTMASELGNHRTMVGENRSTILMDGKALLERILQMTKSLDL